MGNLQRPAQYHMKDLTLDVSLRTCLNGSEYDFTGRKTFNTGFFRESVGFGITDIGIEINPSLQPSIEITFKDLYGKTMFGNQKVQANGYDTSVLFDWPPPKFIFSFKGYLGRKVTWLLNLKTTNVTYVPSDGSYEIKCMFVPNQWGFLADIPVLYLLACKKLRKEYYGKDDRMVGSCKFKTDSIFSYIRIGKQVDTKTKETTKEFDSLVSQLSALKYNASDALYKAKKITPGAPISGVVNSVPIKDFTNIVIPVPTTPSEQELKDMMLRTDVANQLNSFLLLSAKKDETKNSSNFDTATYKLIASKAYNYGEIKGDGLKTSSGADLVGEKKKVTDVIDANLASIDLEIKRRIFNSAKKEISKLTIGEVFQQISRDAGFILGAILQAGLRGYADNKDARNATTNKLIGRSFPLIINDKGEEVPAVGFGVEENEMAFVNKFIEAIGQGIAENMVDEDTSQDDKLQKVINNLEVIKGNPYKPFYFNIAENVLIRSGIISYVTRSGNPEEPGEYGATVKSAYSYDEDNDYKKLTSLAEEDVSKNLTKSIVSQISFEDKASLRRFCKFWSRLSTKDGTSFNYPYEETANPNWILGTSTLKDANTAVSDDVLDYRIVIDDYTSKSVKDLYATVAKDNVDAIKTVISQGATADGVTKSVSQVQTMSVREMMNEMINPQALTLTGQTDVFYFEDVEEIPEQPVAPNTAQVDTKTLSSYFIRNNGINYFFPSVVQNGKYYVMFSTLDDVSKTKGASSSAGEDAWDEARPKGVVQIDGVFKEESDVFPRIKWFNGTMVTIHSSDDMPMPTIDAGRVLDYSALSQVYTKPDTANPGKIVIDKDRYQFKFKIQSEKTLQANEVEAKNLAYAVYSHMPGGNGWSGPDVVFGPFAMGGAGDYRSSNQRACMKAMCDVILKKLEEVEAEQNEIVGTIIGKGADSKNSIYKQMHTIFHQWQVLASSIKGKGLCEEYIPDTKDNLALDMEEEFGDCSAHRNKDVTKSLSDLSNERTKGNTLFVYDYPLASVNGDNTIDVKEAIINIEPLYKPNGTTTILNIVQQICTKNNFVFVPFPGDANSDNITDIYTAFPAETPDRIRNYFHVLFTPTPETRSMLSNDERESTTYHMTNSDFNNPAISFSFGSVENQIVKSINVGTDSTKPTAESIINLQKLVDKDNTNKKVGMDCSMLPIYEGRSYKATVDLIGNAQVYPMQYFYIEKMPMFGGLYQTMKVSHNITPNNMSTKAEGIRMRFSTSGGVGGKYGGIPPVTLGSLEALGGVLQPLTTVQSVLTAGSITGTTSPYTSASGGSSVSTSTTSTPSGSIQIAGMPSGDSGVPVDLMGNSSDERAADKKLVVRMFDFGISDANFEKVCRTFAPRIHPIRKTPNLHPALDMNAGNCGVTMNTKIYAPWDGNVKVRRPDPNPGEKVGCGNYLQVEFNNGFTMDFMHLNSFAITASQKSFKKGQLLGYVGTTGSSTGAHLHLQIFYPKYRNVFINPKNYFVFKPKV